MSATAPLSLENALDVEPLTIEQISQRTRAIADAMTPLPLPDPPPQLPTLHPCVSNFVSAASAALSQQHLRTQTACENLYTCASAISGFASAATAVDADQAQGFGQVHA